ncbi:MAG TPA: ELWxxDGT repeat protein [Candidatus Limnocylindrales bacterium]|nr:ELWxxDGT repeat protein [Candidatus Limnocylindrales bacterium]
MALLGALALASSSVLAAPVIQSLGDLNVASGDGDPSNFTKFGTKILFVATDETKGREIWRTDGTTAGTRIIKDINPGGDSWPNGFFIVNGVALFSADNGGGDELWRTDGTAAGTKKVKDINGDPNTGSLDGISARYGSYLYFYADDGVHGIELWRSDGTAAGTKMLKDVNVGSGDSDRCCPRQLGNIVLFQAFDPAHGYELWRTGGTPGTTTFVADVNSGPNASYPLDDGVVAGSRYFFCAWPTSDLWVTDGTPGGTALVKDFDYCVNPHPYGNDVLVTARSVGSSVELWRSDGTPGGTAMVTDLNPTGDSYPNLINDQPVNGKYFVAADDGTHGRELFVYNGSTLSLVEDINPSGGSGIGQTGNRRMALGNRFVFEADDGVHGYEPWITDGTAPGTFLLKDIAPGLPISESYAEVALNGMLYFSAENATYGRELWRTNGTQLGTKRITDLNPGGGGSWPNGLTAINGKIYLSADDGTHGFEPYRLTP